ncbi:F-box/FBD/LRR-repeat protein At1g13570-like [Solanum lycopersicum]|uniref:F-box/FBD/LRR-repeat protein At1g13570-like n=1 Tax=Solanum lycopersicum TaxID=4081 RepID=UPI0037497601
MRLKLKYVTLFNNTFDSLISNNSLLQDLMLKDIDNLYLMSINAPNIRSFVFRGDIELIYLENVPVLYNVLYAPREMVLEDEDDFISIFSSIPTLECFSRDLSDFDNGSTEVIPTRLQSTLNCVKYLFISLTTLRDDGDYFRICAPGGFDEISASFLDITFNHLRTVMFDDVLLEEGEMQLIKVLLAKSPAPVKMEVVDEIPTSFLDITFNHLRTVKFYDVLLEEVEMQLIKVLLAKSPELVKMVIQPRQMETNKSLNVLTEKTMIQQASSKAEVVYLVD